jgi:cbb3-type cytochrome oxidase maturation protein
VTSPGGATAFLVLWITFAVVALGGVIAAFVWAVRNRQFSDQDRARYLPLVSGIPEPEEDEAPAGPPARGPAEASEGGDAHASP